MQTGARVHSSTFRSGPADRDRVVLLLRLSRVRNLLLKICELRRPLCRLRGNAGGEGLLLGLKITSGGGMYWFLLLSNLFERQDEEVYRDVV
jgi:hypothetical protein